MRRDVIGCWDEFSVVYEKFLRNRACGKRFLRVKLESVPEVIIE